MSEHYKGRIHAPGLAELMDEADRCIGICIDTDPVEEEKRPSPDLDEGNANARRLSAAWNFVDGIPTEELEKAGDVAGYVSSKTMLTGITPGKGGVDIGFEGGACAILAASFAEQFVTAGATNYLEVGFAHERTGPLLVTLQRVEGKTPSTLRREAEKQRDELIETLEKVLAHFTRTPSTLADTTVRGDAHAVIKRIREAS